MAKKRLTIEQIAERYRKNQLALNKANMSLEAKISGAKAAYQSLAKPLLEELEEDMAAITKHADTYRDRMFPGDAKSTEWYGLKLGYRLNAKSIQIPEKLTAEEVVTKLEALELYELINTKTSLDKKAILKAIQEGTQVAKKLRNIGIEVTQSETFSVKV